MGKRGNRSRNRRSGKNTGSGQGKPKGGEGTPRTSQSNQTGRGGQDRKKRRTVPFDPEKHYLPDPVPEREYEPCVVSGEEIDDIYTAISDPNTGKPARFDKVIARIAATETLEEGERIAYIGKGAFGIVKMEQEGSDRPHLVVRKRIEYESGGDSQEWRKELSPGISRDYVPKPRPLSELYSQEDLREFPRFDSPSSSFTTRNN
jgi:hypothetical protein